MAAIAERRVKWNELLLNVHSAQISSYNTAGRVNNKKKSPGTVLANLPQTLVHAREKRG